MRTFMSSINMQQRAAIALTLAWLLACALYWGAQILQCTQNEQGECVFIFWDDMSGLNLFFYEVAHIFGLSSLGSAGGIISSIVIFPMAMWIAISLLMILLRWILAGR